MSGFAAQSIVAAFVVFSRIGACLMLMPGFSSPRVPVQVRLFISIALSLAITPLIYDQLGTAIGSGEPLVLMRLMLTEMLTGALIGMMGRVFFVALETMGMALSLSIGLSSNLGAPVNEDEPLPAIATMLTLGATALLFLSDLHIEIFKALAGSYMALPPGEGFSAQHALTQLVDKSTQAFMLALRICSPFLIFSAVLNFSIGLTNKLVPAVQIFFLSSPFLILGGLLLLYFTLKPLLHIFVSAFGMFLVNG